MTLPQQFTNLLLRGVGCVRRNSRDIRNLQTRTPQNFLLHGGVRREGDVVLITALRILPLARHHSDDAERKILHTNGLPHRIGAGKHVVGNRLADD